METTVTSQKGGQVTSISKKISHDTTSGHRPTELLYIQMKSPETATITIKWSE